ncbi:sensor histidine kinase [Nocardioides sp. URHA0020]|uniref:sensor histidine kinase n=1 Tax=Nocardioides sp. URHA0020 TaxID=1380392 RepID=UPI00048E60EA|nr:GAF domain-containing sensor histidine kinase [Nocardioides sp. URHA0020]
MARDVTPEQTAARLRWSDSASRDTLQLIAEGVTQVAGFGIAAISVVRQDGGLESVAVAGSDEARAELEGTRSTEARLLEELAKADDWGLLRFVPHDRTDEGVGDTWGWVPDYEPIDAPDAWHPLDLLIAPLYDDDGALLGTLAMDLPVGGRRPDEAQRAVLNAYAEQAGRAVVVALEREALAEQVRMAEAARRIVRRASAQLSLDRIVSDSQDAVIEGFRAAGMWIHTFGRGEGDIGHIYSSDGQEIRLEPTLVRIAEQTAVQAWRQQQAVVIAPDRGFEPLTDQQAGAVLDFLRSIDVESLLFIPLGAGPECLGNLVLTRLAGAPAWTEAEATTALDIGHDLGRAILNARTFEREHQLVVELQELDAYKGQLIATVAHELKNPLSSVLGHLEILDGTPDLPGRTKGSLAAMERGAQRMVKVIDDLLLLSKVGDPDNPVISRPVDLRRVVDDVVDLVGLSAQQKRIDLRVEVPDEPVFAVGDPDELDRVCGNLLSNAVKYTPEGGVVTVSLAVADGEVVFTCHDMGIGMSADDVRHLGTEFFRSSNPIALAQPGTGLGLAIVRRIVARHDGRLEIDSELGRGSTFQVHLPAA